MSTPYEKKCILFADGPPLHAPPEASAWEAENGREFQPAFDDAGQALLVTTASLSLWLGFDFCRDYQETRFKYVGREVMMEDD